MLTALLFFVLIGAIALLVVYSLWSGIPPMPTSLKEKKALFSLLPEKLEGPIYELGSGWGTLAIPLARKYPHCQVIAVELSPIPYLFSLLRKAIFGPKNLQFIRKDFFILDLSRAALIVCFLFPGAMERLSPKLRSELLPKTPVVSNSFALPGWTPAQEITIQTIHHSKVYLYHASVRNIAT